MNVSTPTLHSHVAWYTSLPALGKALMIMNTVHAIQIEKMGAWHYGN